MMLVDYYQYYVKDYMRCEVGDTLLILVSQYFEDKKILPWSDLFTIQSKPMEVTFTKHNYIGFNADVVTILLSQKLQVVCIFQMTCLVSEITITDVISHLIQKCHSCCHGRWFLTARLVAYKYGVDRMNTVMYSVIMLTESRLLVVYKP